MRLGARSREFRGAAARPSMAGRPKGETGEAVIGPFDHSGREDPLALWRKEALLARDHPLYERFAGLTRHEGAKGLLWDAVSTATCAKLDGQFRAAGLTLRGHRLWAGSRPP